MAKVAFNVDAYAARLIGRENISTLEGAILEIVKNSYDADAKICLIYFDEMKEVLYIADNGVGMTEETIRSNWMTIGNSTKNENFITEKGRIQNGAKGIGRFALDRIASQCKMLTKSYKTSLEWTVDWETFTLKKNITEIYADINENGILFSEYLKKIENKHVTNLIENEFNSTGTVFVLEGLRDQWNNFSIKKLKSKLSTIIPPDKKNNFKIFFFTAKDSNEEALIESKYVDSYDYKLEFNVSDTGDCLIKIHRNEFDFRGKEEFIRKNANFNEKDMSYFNDEKIIIEKHISNIISFPDNFNIDRIGEFEGEIYFFKKTATNNDKEKFYYKDFSGRQKMPEKFGGIKIYRDNFRVRPYGEYLTSNYDWLLLDNRKAKSPAAPTHEKGAWRVNAEQIIGEIYISRLNMNLRDQANREGIVESQEFVLFKESIIEFIKMLESDRQYVLRILDELYDQINITETFEKEIIEKASIQEEKELEDKDKDSGILNKSVSANVDKGNYVEATKAKAVIEKKDKEIRNLEDENRMLRALATTGILANTYMHEMKTVTHKLGIELRLAGTSLQNSNFDKSLNHINNAKAHRESFNEWFKVTLESIRKDRREMKKHSINSIVNDLIITWGNILSTKKIKISVNHNAEIYIKCYPYEIEGIINNLIANSINAFEKNGNSDKVLNIDIILDENDSEFHFIYQDNGPGLSPKYKEDPYKILIPLESDKRDENNEIIGTGMGMWIIDKTINEYKGRIELGKNSKMESGFYTMLALNKN